MLKVIDYFTHALDYRENCIRFVNDIVDNIEIYEYTSLDSKLIKVVNKNAEIFYNKEKFADKVIFNKSIGCYQIATQLTDRDLVYCKYGATSGYFYSFLREYGASKHLNLFSGKQHLINPEIDFKLSHFLKYSIGLEFETATGIIPEETCFRDGLIPLRDGSISGNEYSTVVLNGNYGLNLLKQQIETMKEYTYFDKNCSLHIHLGNINLVPEFIYNVYLICVNLQNQLQSILPALTFNSGAYKNTGKDYCKRLPTGLKSFDQLYRYMVEMPYFGDLCQPHPRDITRERKWNIDKRYYFVNFINALCYKGNKTIEFRFLRPSYNFNKIIFWIYIFNAILLNAENNVVPNSLEELVANVYPTDIAKDLLVNIVKVGICSDLQRNVGDSIGERVDIENHIFNTSELI